MCCEWLYDKAFKVTLFPLIECRRLLTCTLLYSSKYRTARGARFQERAQLEIEKTYSTLVWKGHLGLSIELQSYPFQGCDELFSQEYSIFNRRHSCAGSLIYAHRA